MAAPVTVEAGAVLQALGAIEARAGNLTPVWLGVVDPAVRAMATETFATEGAFIGERWAKLSPTTLALKKRAGRSQMGVLRMFDVLFRSLTIRSSPDGVRIATPDSYTFGTDVPYAHFHQDGWVSKTIFGKPKQRLKVLPRKVLPEGDLPLSVRETIEAGMARYVTDGRV